MSNLKELRNRIRSVENTKQITQAMKMVAAAKLRRSQERAESVRPYSNIMQSMMQSVASGMVGSEAAPALLREVDDERHVRLVVMTSDRGLCGGFNSSIVRAVRAKVIALQAEGKEVTITCVGSKGHDVLKRQFAPLIRDVHVGVAKGLSLESVDAEIVKSLIKEFQDGDFSTCHIIYNAFVSAMTQKLTWKQVMPVPVDESSDAAGGHDYEPSEEEILETLLPRSTSMVFFQGLVESDAAEHGARMTAMDSAVRNASDMINKLTITYNRTRQAVITTELMEIIGGAESLKG